MTRREQAIRCRLTQRRRELLVRYRDELARADEELAERETEDVERATEQWDVRVLDSLGQADHRSLVALGAALRRLDDGRYGLCIECGERISRPRLRALPDAATCIECASSIAKAAGR